MSTLKNAPQPTHPRRVAWALSIVCLVAACAGPSETVPRGSAPIVGGPSPLDTQVTPAPSVAREPAMVDKIAAAELAGTLDHDTALVYELYAALDVASLPAEYQSKSPAAPEATIVLGQLSGRLDELTPDLRARVEPFLKRPTETGSFWATRHQPKGAQGAPIAMAAGPMALGTTTDIEYDFTDVEGSTPIRVWFATGGGASDRVLAERLATEIDIGDMWGKEREAMLGREPCTDHAQGVNDSTLNGGSDALDVYLIYPVTGLDWHGRSADLRSVDAGTAEVDVAMGMTSSVGQGVDCPTVTYIVLNAAQAWDKLRATMAHELFHSFQFALEGFGRSDHRWWIEASATWAEDLVYPKLDTEREYLKGYWSHSELWGAGPLDSTEGTAEYASYLWPFFMRQDAGGDSTEIGWLWAASTVKSPLEVLRDTDGWAATFKKFALWNWNDDSVIEYADSDRPIPTAELGQDAECLGPDCGIQLGTRDLRIELDGTSIKYYKGTPDVDVEQMRFDLTDLQGKAGAGLQAIISIGEPGPGAEVRVEDWTGLDKRIFCLSREDVRKVVLVASNSEIAAEAKVSGKISIEALAEGCGPGGLVTFNRTIVKSVVTPTQCGGGATVDETHTVTISVAFDGQNKGTATVSDQGHSVEVSTSIDCPTGKTWTVTTTRDEHVVGTKDIFLFWWTNAGVLDFNAVWEHITGGTSLFEIRCVPTLPSCDQTTTGDLTSAYISVAFKADVDEKAAVMSGSKVEDLSSEGESDIITYTWTIER